ncbi:hypothetical protein D9619_012119 [Psilocybe cf. subviscida]|uniref:Uncharacterized protein n=1 Tax=Psilocybe cf. subviscida TaxID=2480587 RepID=A0A8H5EZC5_9AGAR|nr:hypothetical protein D9619_012119 [Psilocybe cf. subviscida]
MPKVVKDENTPATAKSKQTRSRKKAQVEVQDKSLWRPSTINETEKITKTAAMSEYHLSAADLEGLTYERKLSNRMGFARPMQLYTERDVEQRAWEKHGGPEGFESFLKDKREKFYQKNGYHSGKFFPQPHAYMPTAPPAQLVDSVVDQSSSSPESAVAFTHHMNDPTTPTPVLYDMKQVMVRDGKEWLWDRLHHCFNVQGTHYAGHNEDRRLENVITAAMPDFVMRYDRRPEPDHVDTSPSFTSLRDVLSRAARYYKDSYEYEGLHVQYDPFKVDWTREYYGEVYIALSKITEEHGVSGWKKARWLVYDKYTECKLGKIRYFQESKQASPNFGKWIWQDGAGFWLHASEYPFMDEQQKSAFLESLQEPTKP